MLPDDCSIAPAGHILDTRRGQELCEVSVGLSHIGFGTCVSLSDPASAPVSTRTPPVQRPGASFMKDRRSNPRLFFHGIPTGRGIGGILLSSFRIFLTIRAERVAHRPSL